MANERILVMGKEGSGKTYQLLKLAAWLKDSGAQFYVLDTDDSYERSLEEFPGLSAEEGGNVHVTFGFDWAEYVDWLDETLPKVTKNRDWLVVDRIGKAWGRVQNFCSEDIYSQSLADRLLEARKRNSKKAMVVGANDQADWQVINAQYNGWFMRLMYKSRCNIWLATDVSMVRGSDNESLRDIYGPLGAKPEGQKSLGSEPHTVLLFSRAPDAKWYMSSAKDRGKRTYYDKQALVDFPKQYLMGQANWSQDGAP